MNEWIPINLNKMRLKSMTIFLLDKLQFDFGKNNFLSTLAYSNSFEAYNAAKITKLKHFIDKYFRNIYSTYVYLFCDSCY